MPRCPRTYSNRETGTRLDPYSARISLVSRPGTAPVVEDTRRWPDPAASPRCRL